MNQGDKVVPNQVIGEIYQQDLKDTIRGTIARLDQLRDENAKLIRFETDEQTTQERAIAKVKEAITRTIQNSTQGLKVAVKIVQGSQRLQLISQLSNLDYLKDLQQKYTIQNDLNNGFVKTGGAGPHEADLGEPQATWPTSAAAGNQQAQNDS